MAGLPMTTLVHQPSQITDIQKDILFVILDFLDTTDETLKNIPELFIGDIRFSL